LGRAFLAEGQHGGKHGKLLASRENKCKDLEAGRHTTACLAGVGKVQKFTMEAGLVAGAVHTGTKPQAKVSG
jgi:hypothetical protein